MRQSDWIDELAYPLSGTAPWKLSEIGREAIDLFDQFRDSLLRYSLSFGIPMHEAEEVVHEVFLSLFRHLQLGRSKSNLRGLISTAALDYSDAPKSLGYSSKEIPRVEDIQSKPTTKDEPDGVASSEAEQNSY